MTGPMRFREVFPGGEKAAGHARRVLARWLVDVMPADRLGDIQLLVTEIVANCVRHGRVGEDGQIDMIVSVADSVIRSEVRDTGIQAEPRVRTPDLSGGGGFGMLLVERMSSAWGVDHEPNVVMWFELSFEPEAGGAGSEAARAGRPFARRTRKPRRSGRFRLGLRAGGLALAAAI